MVLYKDVDGKFNHKGEWLLLDTKKKRVLKIFGKKKPTHEEFLKQEKRIQFFKHKT